MVTICAKKFCQPTIQDIMLAKIRKRKENQNIEDFFQNLKQQREKGNSWVLSGTTLPNSTFKSLHGRKGRNDESVSSIYDNSDKVKSGSSIVQKQSPSLRSLRRNAQDKEPRSDVIIKPDETRRNSSLLSGTSTLEELKELKTLLHKSSYAPKKTKTRRPTIEKIKSAIIKEKKNLADKNESTMNNSINLSDASTATDKIEEKIKKIKRKSGTKKSSLAMARSTSRSIDSRSKSSTIQNDRKGKRIKKKKKITSKVDVEIQCSIFKVNTNT